MIPRRIQTLVEDRLAYLPAVALLGPRQVGKTTLAHSGDELSGFRASDVRVTASTKPEFPNYSDGQEKMARVVQE
jgi:hypothetical protein